MLERIIEMLKNLDERKLKIAYAGTDMTMEEVWEECICDALGDMNIFAGTDSNVESYMEGFLGVTKKAAQKNQQTMRGPPVSTDGKYSRYWRPNLSKDERSLLNRTLEKELSSEENYIDEATKWAYSSEKGTNVFAIYGIGDGTDATPLYVVGGEKAKSDNVKLQNFLEGFNNESDEDRTAFDSWIKSVRGEQRDSVGNLYDTARRRSAVVDDGLHGVSQKRDGKGTSGAGKENRKNSYSRRLSTDELAKEIDRIIDDGRKQGRS